MKIDMGQDPFYEYYINVQCKFHLDGTRKLTDIKHTYEIISALNRESFRNILNIFIKVSYTSYNNIISCIKNKYIQKGDSIGFENIKDIYDKLYKLNLSDDEIRDIWIYFRHRQFHISKQYGYSAEQHKEHRDNKNYVNYNGGSNCNKIRYPKKCRKTAWKRFYKIFPHLNPENKKDEENF